MRWSEHVQRREGDGAARCRTTALSFLQSARSFEVCCYMKNRTLNKWVRVEEGESERKPRPRTKSTFGQSHDPLLRTTQKGFILLRLHRKGRMKFLELFGRLKSVVIGMIHVKALPGSPLGSLKMSEISEAACREAAIYRDAGVDGLIVENMHDVPYSLSVGPEVSACMTAVCCSVRAACPSLPIGAQILTAANQQALAVALASGLDFIRAEGFVFAHVADEGLLNAGAGDLLRYRKQIGAEHVQIFTDIKKKHSSHALTSDVSVAETARAAEFFLSDGVIITGAATGLQADPEELRGPAPARHTHTLSRC